MTDKDKKDLTQAISVIKKLINEESTSLSTDTSMEERLQNIENRLKKVEELLDDIDNERMVNKMIGRGPDKKGWWR